MRIVPWIMTTNKRLPKLTQHQMSAISFQAISQSEEQEDVNLKGNFTWKLKIFWEGDFDWLIQRAKFEEINQFAKRSLKLLLQVARTISSLTLTFSLAWLAPGVHFLQKHQAAIYIRMKSWKVTYKNKNLLTARLQIASIDSHRELCEWWQSLSQRVRVFGERIINFHWMIDASEGRIWTCC